MPQIENKLSFEDKELIKKAVLESIAKQSEPAEELAKQACKAISYINSHKENYTTTVEQITVNQAP